MKKKLEELTQTHGKTETFRPSTLDQIWGDTGLNKYNTLDEQEYSNTLSEMNKSDLMSHSARMGIVPADSRERMVKRLMTAFRQHVSGFRSSNIPQPKPTRPNKAAMDILAEGR